MPLFQSNCVADTRSTDLSHDHDARRVGRVMQLRGLLKQLKSKGIISKYEVTKEKASFNRCITGNKFTVKVEGLTGDLPSVLPMVIRVYLPEAGVKSQAPGKFKMSENVDASLKSPTKEVDTLVALRLLNRLLDVCITTPQSNDGRRTIAMQHAVNSYI